jgi:hypothetical protein
MVIIYHIIISLNRTIKSSKSIAEPSFFLNEKRSGIKENLFHCCCGGNCYRDCWIIKNICFRIRNFETAVSGKVKNLYGTAVFVLIFILIFEEKTHKEISPFSHGKSEL